MKINSLPAPTAARRRILSRVLLSLFSILLLAIPISAESGSSDPRPPSVELSDTCPRDIFEWLADPAPWPLEPIFLGGLGYSRADLQALFADVDDEELDISLRLAGASAAAQLNQARGVAWAPVDDLLAKAQDLLTVGVSLPYDAADDTTLSLQIAASLAPFNSGEYTEDCPFFVSVEPPESCPMPVRDWAELEKWPTDHIAIAGETIDPRTLKSLLAKPGSSSRDPVHLLKLETVAAELNKAQEIRWEPLDGILEQAHRGLEESRGKIIDPCSDLGVELAVQAAKLQRFNGSSTLDACLREGTKRADLQRIEARVRASRCHDFWGFADLHTHMFAEFGWNERFIEGSIDDLTLGAPEPEQVSLERCSGRTDHASLNLPELLLVSEMLTSVPKALPSHPLDSASPGDSGFHLFRRNGFDTRTCQFACLGPATCLTRTTEQACLAADPGFCRDDIPNNVSLAATIACNTQPTRGDCQGTGYCGARQSSLWSIVDDLNPCWAEWPNCDGGDRCLKRNPLLALTCQDLNQAECQNHPNECDWEASCRHQSGSLTCNDLNQNDCSQYSNWCDWKPDRCVKDPLNPLPFQCNNLSQNDCGKYSECSWNGIGSLGVCLNNLSGSLTCGDLDAGDCSQYNFYCNWKSAECKKDPWVFDPFECNDLDQNDCGTYSECGWQEQCKHPLLAPSLECSDLNLAECANHGGDGCGVRDCVEVGCEWQDWGECRWDAIWPPNCGEHFQDWPAWDTPTHQQHWWGHLEDAWRRGLRVVSASILEVDPLAVLMDGGAQRTPFEVIVDQLEAANAFAARHPWVEIALDAEQAHDIAEAGNLALVLTLEANFPFCTARPCGRGADEEDFANIQETLDTYFALGLRGYQVISHFDNPYAGVAIYNTQIHTLQWLYDEMSEDGQITEAEMTQALDVPMVIAFAEASNELQARAPLLPIPNFSDLFPINGFGEITDVHSLIASFGGARGPQCIRRDNNAPLSCATCLTDEIPCQNIRGLTPLGEELVERLVELGMLIDIAHLSELGVEDVWRVVRDVSPTGTYPLYISHGDPREALDPNGHKGPDQEKPTPQWVFNIIRQSGGMFGLRTGPDQFLDEPTSLVANDCAGSSKSFAQALEHILEVADVNMGFALDMNGMIANAAPRFVDRLSRKMRKRGEDAACLGNRWQQTTQRAGVPDDPNTPFTDESRYNTHGLAHVGHLGSLIDDLENSGLPADVTGAIFSSAEEFIDMWQRIP